MLIKTYLLLLPFDLQTLSCAYAEHLVEQQQAEQAGLLLWRCGEPARALQAFATSSSWRNAICVAQQIPLPPDQLALLARDLAGKRRGRGRVTSQVSGAAAPSSCFCFLLQRS